MEKKSKRGIPLGRKLQLILLTPLTIALVVSTVFVIVIVMVSQSNWLSNTKTHVMDNEESFMYSLSQIIGNDVKSSVCNSWYYIYLMSELLLGVNSSSILASPGLSNPSTINGFSNAISKYPDLDLSVWVSGDTGNSITDLLSSLRVPDVFMRNTYSSIEDLHQIGFLIAQGNYLYLYPLQNMDYIFNTYNNSATCPGSTSTAYSPVCTQEYSILSNTSLNKYLNLYYDNGMFNIHYRTSFGAGIGIWPEDYFIKRIFNTTTYRVFVAEYLGDWVLYLSNTSVGNLTGTHKELSKLMYSADTDRADFTEQIMPLVNSRNGTARVRIGGESTYFSVSGVQMLFNSDGENETAYVVGVSRQESEILMSWTRFIRQVLVTSIIQACIFFVFCVGAILVICRLALIIAHRVTNPLTQIVGYLNEDVPPLCSITNSYNSQINSILANLKSIEKLNHLIDPSFLMHPVCETRVQNLRFALGVFEEIENKRGVSIVYNLLGNAEFSKQRYQLAEEYYRQSLIALEEILEEIEAQEREESELTDREREKLNSKHHEFTPSWKEEKRFLKESICEKLQQICMAMTQRLKEDPDSAAAMRGKWKELLRLQTRVLQHYENSRSNYKLYLQLLLDMAEVFQILQYFYTASELLKMVGEELCKLDRENRGEIDVDVNRLRRIGIDVVEANSGLQQFQVREVTFEKDVLMQRMLYRRAMIERDNNKDLKAIADLTALLVRQI